MLFFDHKISITQFWNYRMIDFFRFFFIFFNFFPFLFFLQMNMPSGNMQHCKSQKKNFTSVFLFIYCYCYWLYHLIDFFRLLDQSIDFSIFFNWSIEFFDFLKWSIIDQNWSKNYQWSGSLFIVRYIFAMWRNWSVLSVS